MKRIPSVTTKMERVRKAYAARRSAARAGRCGRRAGAAWTAYIGTKGGAGRRAARRLHCSIGVMERRVGQP